MAPQLTATKGPLRTEELACTICAMRSLPAPFGSRDQHAHVRARHAAGEFDDPLHRIGGEHDAAKIVLLGQTLAPPALLILQPPPLARRLRQFHGFNKPHAAAYALITYQTAYLKANYPVEFLAASMTLDLGNTDKLNVFRQELKRLGIRLLPPDIDCRGDVRGRARCPPFPPPLAGEGRVGVNPRSAMRSPR